MKNKTIQERMELADALRIADITSRRRSKMTGLLSINEDTYDEINAELLELAARSMEDDASDAGKPSRVLIGSGEDCQFVLFSTNYKPSYVQ